ncbi:MAG: helix-turn-helix domain-containing protein [Solirubrobacteraceae bacterium]
MSSPDAERGSIDEHIRNIAAAADVEALAESMTQRLFAEQLIDHAADPAIRRVGYDSVYGNLAALFASLAGAPRQDDGGPEAFAVLAVEVGLSSRDVERLYRRGQSIAVEMWLHTAQAYARERDLVLAPLLDEPNERIHGHIDSVVPKILEAYDAEVARRRRSREERRARVVLQMLSGELTPNLAEIDEFLDYRLGAAHLALWVRANKDVITTQASRGLMHASGAARVLTVPLNEVGRWALWLADGRDTAELRAQLSKLHLTGAYASGGPGLAGFRLAHRRAARAAAAHAAAAGVGVVAARDVHLNTLILAAPEVARDFAAVELAALADDSPAADRLRGTLSAFLETGSLVGAAARLGVHQHTVRNRVRQAEGLLGFTLPSRRTELELALRLRAMLGPPAPDGDDEQADTNRAPSAG